MKNRLPMPGGFRRKALAGLLILLCAPMLLEAGLMAIAGVVQIIEHIVDMVWPWVVAVLLLLLGAYTIRAFYYRRRW
jgi:hypothetical protein